MKNAYSTFAIWRRQVPENGAVSRWIRTGHAVTARTQTEAQSKMESRFRDAGFSHMQLVAVIGDQDPNILTAEESPNVR